MTQSKFLNGVRVFLLFLALGLSAPSFAEEGCSGPTYDYDPTCGGVDVNCALADCQDISFGQDGSLYQCCPPGASVPEHGLLPLTPLILLLTLIPIFYFRRRRVKNVE